MDVVISCNEYMSHEFASLLESFANDAVVDLKTGIHMNLW